MKSRAVAFFPVFDTVQDGGYNSGTMHEEIRPAGLAGSLRIPASKSHTIRALLIASLAGGESHIRNALDSADTRSCIEACRALGARVEGPPDHLVVRGTAGHLRVPDHPIDVGNSGTTLYLAAGMAALAGGPVTFTGDDQIRVRSAAPLLDSLRDLGAEVSVHRENGCAPFTVRGPLRGGRTVIECHTSQYLSSLLLCAPLCAGPTEIGVPLLNEKPYVEMTLDWLDGQGIEYANNGFAGFTIPGGQRYHRFDRSIPGDFSSAAFFLCAAAVTRSTLTLEGLDMADSQGDKAVVAMLRELGCSIDIFPDALTITGRRMRGTDLDLNATPDALPALAAAACYAEGTTRLVNVPQARMKETDRITVMREELMKMGADVEELEDGLVIRGSELTGAEVDGRGDHRVVMALAVAGLGAAGPIRIATAESAGITYPRFFDELRRLTMD